MLKTKTGFLVVLLGAIISCNRDDDALMKKSDAFIERESLSKQSVSPLGIATCSYRLDGEIKSWSPGSFNLFTHATSWRKYTWRVSGDVDSYNPIVRLQFKIKVNSSYPVVVRVIGIKSGSEDGDVIESCYRIQQNGGIKEYDLNVETKNGWFGYPVGVYKYYQFEVILDERQATGYSDTIVPVQVSLCKSYGGSCSGYPSF